MHAAATDMEPGMVFLSHKGGPDLVWSGVDHVHSRFAGRERVRVLARTRGGDSISFVCDRGARFPVVWAGDR